MVLLLVFAPGSRPLLGEFAPQFAAQKHAFLLAVHLWRQLWDCGGEHAGACAGLLRVGSSPATTVGLFVQTVHRARGPDLSWRM
jgi:hypothetical protein